MSKANFAEIYIYHSHKKAHMALRVIVDGKPCSGKTTISHEVESMLRSDGIPALDAKAFALEKGMLAGLLRRFPDTEINSFRELAVSGIRHTLSYVALEASAWQNDARYEVMLLQRSPYAFSFMMDAASIALGGVARHAPSRLAYSAISAWAGMVRPELFIYLTADTGILRQRFAERKEGKDRIHKLMIEQDDSRHVALLRGYMGANFHIVDNSSDIRSAAETVCCIIKERLNNNERDSQRRILSRDSGQHLSSAEFS